MRRHALLLRGDREGHGFGTVEVLALRIIQDAKSITNVAAINAKKVDYYPGNIIVLIEIML